MRESGLDSTGCARKADFCRRSAGDDWEDLAELP
jgi:hypothetical protein